LSGNTVTKRKIMTFSSRTLLAIALALVGCTTRESANIGTHPNLPSEPIIYVVERGDSVTSISRKFQVSALAILANNPGLNPSRLWVGQRLRLTRGKIVDVRNFPSPDGKYICTMFGEMFYDTTGYPRYIDLHRAEEKWSYPGNVYIVPVGDDAAISWSSPTNLSIALSFETRRNLPPNANLGEVAITFSEVLRTFFLSYFCSNWRCKDFGRLAGLASYFVAE
jgi:hypothetical protein